MSIVRLGKIHLHWCESCNLPIVEKNSCGICGSTPKKVKITPPGDVRPAFEEDVKLIKKTIDRQWGTDYSKKVLSRERPVLLNGIPYEDRMDEVIIDGQVIGAIRYNPSRKLDGKEPYEFILRPWKGLDTPKKNYVIVDEGAVEPILNGGSVLNPGIIEADPEIKEGEEIIVSDKNGKILCSGRSKLPGKELVNSSSGRGVKNRWRVSDFSPTKKEKSWDEVVEANKSILKNKENESVKFVEKHIDEHDIPVAVAYSGGKDSLATLHILLKSKAQPDILFIDTGIELPETIENVYEIAEKYNLTLHEKKAESGYWKNVEYFGPSARDYRWCCKTCKLGPTSLLIKEKYDDGVLSFIGQRRYESRQRMSHGSTWDNPWVPGQVSASPIQDWTALHIWLYLFWKDADWNIWYEDGFERIGCWVCPASNLSEFDKLKDEFDEYDRFEDVLQNYAEKNDLPQEWVELGLWRWINIPENMEKHFQDFERKADPNPSKIIDETKKELLKDERSKNLLNAYSDSVEDLSRDDILVQHKKALNCVECGVCVAQCEKGALSFDDGIKIDEKRCVHCESCLGKCPVVDFDSRVNDQSASKI